MGVLVDFKKVREDEKEVEYIYGFNRVMDRHLVIQKDTQKARPLDGEKDPAYSPAFMGILKRHRRDGTWPEVGLWAS
jgi:hypothetical protein